jgi:hypothetical protein
MFDYAVSFFEQIYPGNQVPPGDELYYLLVGHRISNHTRLTHLRRLVTLPPPDV